MRNPFVAANWKMHKSIADAVRYAEIFRGLVHDASVEVVLAPPFTALRGLADALTGSSVGVAGQDLYWEPQGAFTGQVSAEMLKEAGASHVIIGHSERRQIFGETDEQVNKKVKTAIAGGLTPIVCVGETLDQRDTDQTLTVLTEQIQLGLREMTSDQAAELVVAYEPVWAIGTGRNASPDQAQQAHAHIRSRLEVAFGTDAAARCRVIYGGSVKPGNVAQLSEQPDVDGSLVGGAGLDPDSFAEIVAKS